MDLHLILFAQLPEAFALVQFVAALHPIHHTGKFFHGPFLFAQRFHVRTILHAGGPGDTPKTHRRERQKSQAIQEPHSDHANHFHGCVTADEIDRRNCPVSINGALLPFRRIVLGRFGGQLPHPADANDCTITASHAIPTSANT